MTEIIVASDIFGRTCALEELAGNLINVTIIDPYEGRYMDFSDEDEAYAYFQENVGLQRYKKIIIGAIAQTERDLRLVGFSVGAAAIWAISGDDFLDKNIYATCFYGSQIRHDINVAPKFPVLLCFPQYEPHFDVSILISKLSPKKLVTCSMVPHLHGFMNQKSTNFDPTGYSHFMQILQKQRHI